MKRQHSVLAMIFVTLFGAVNQAIVAFADPVKETPKAGPLSRWEGELRVSRGQCRGMPEEIRFTHLHRVLRDRVLIKTSHDGVLRGRARPEMKSLLVGRKYRTSRGFMSVRMAYTNVEEQSANVRYRIGRVEFGSACAIEYVGTALRVR